MRMQPTNTLPSIFISYSRTDSAFVDQLEADLTKYGFKTWLDRQHLEGGDDWARVIEAKIKEYEIIVVVLSPASVASTWVQREIAFAQQIKKDIIPVLGKRTQVPFRISELQFIDFTHDFANSAAELRTTLLKPRNINPPQRREQQPSYTLPKSVVQDVLVDIPSPPPSPPPDLEMLYMQARSAFAREDWDTSETLLQQVVARDLNYDNGAAKADLAIARTNLVPVQIKRLQIKADTAHRAGRWSEEIACWKAVLGIDAYNQDARQRLSIAEQNQRAERTYKRAYEFAKAGDRIATPSEIERLKKEAPYYGDPDSLGRKIGVSLPPNYLEYQEQKVWEQQIKDRQVQDQKAREEQTRYQQVQYQRFLEQERQKVEAKQKERFAIRNGGARGAVWGLCLGMIISAIGYASFVNTHFDLGKSWFGLSAGLIECLLVGGVLSVYGMGINKMWGDLSTKTITINCIIFGSYSGFLMNMANSFELIKADYDYTKMAVVCSVWVGIAIILLVPFFIFFKNLPYRVGGDWSIKMFFSFFFVMLIVPISLIELSQVRQPEVTAFPGIVSGAIISLFVYIILRWTSSSNPPSLNIVFGLSGAAIGVVGGSVWGYATALGGNAGYHTFFSTVEGLLVGGLILTLIGWLLGTVIVAFRYNLSR